MLKHLAFAVAGLSGLLALAGCSGTGAAISGAHLGMNLAKEESYLRLWMDGHKAGQNTLKKAATGYSEWKVKEDTGTKPTLKFEITKPEKFGRITAVIVSIYQQFDADYSHQAEYTIVAKDMNNPQAQMKPGVEYDLGAPGDGFKVMDLTSKEVSGINLIPGKKYKLQLTVRADKSETGQVEFKTK